MLRRWLTARGYDVHFIRNITDIADKVLARSAEQGRPWYNLAYAMRIELDKTYDALNVAPPTYEPAASGHLPEMIEIIMTLIGRGHAYAADNGSGDVYFDVRSWPAYGELTGQRLDDMAPAEDADPRGKRDPRDFAVWKGWKKETEPESAAWPSPWGRGRPGWHVACSAMALKYLGAAFDIHGGGIDLRFPHHENEQAQSRGAGHLFASYWVHNAWITIAGEKMTKSLGNSLSVPAVIQRVRPIDLRFHLVAAHYRSHVEFSFEALDEAALGFERIEHFLTRAHEVLGDVPVGTWHAEFEEAMDDDLGTPAAVAAIYNLVREGNKPLAVGASESCGLRPGQFGAMLSVLGVDPLDEHWEPISPARAERLSTVAGTLISSLLKRRAQARAERDFAAADAIRDQLNDAGIEIEDTPQGPTWAL